MSTVVDDQAGAVVVESQLTASVDAPDRTVLDVTSPSSVRAPTFHSESPSALKLKGLEEEEDEEGGEETTTTQTTQANGTTAKTKDIVEPANAATDAQTASTDHQQAQDDGQAKQQNGQAQPQAESPSQNQTQSEAHSHSRTSSATNGASVDKSHLTHSAADCQQRSTLAPHDPSQSCPPHIHPSVEQHAQESSDPAQHEKPLEAVKEDVKKLETSALVQEVNAVAPWNAEAHAANSNSNANHASTPSHARKSSPSHSRSHSHSDGAPTPAPVPTPRSSKDAATALEQRLAEANATAAAVQTVPHELAVQAPTIAAAVVASVVDNVMAQSTAASPAPDTSATTSSTSDSLTAAATQPNGSEQAASKEVDPEGADSQQPVAASSENAAAPVSSSSNPPSPTAVAAAVTPVASSASSSSSSATSSSSSSSSSSSAASPSQPASIIPATSSSNASAPAADGSSSSSSSSSSTSAATLPHHAPAPSTAGLSSALHGVAESSGSMSASGTGGDHEGVGAAEASTKLPNGTTTTTATNMDGSSQLVTESNRAAAGGAAAGAVGGTETGRGSVAGASGAVGVSNPDGTGTLIRVDRWGNIRHLDPLEAPTAEEVRKERSRRMKRLQTDQLREIKWVKMVAQWDRTISKKSDKVKRRIRKGVPDSLRGAVWPKLTGAAELMRAQPNSSASAAASSSSSSSSSPKIGPGVYARYAGMYSKDQDTIQRDIARTFPNHVFFRDREGVAAAAASAAASSSSSEGGAAANGGGENHRLRGPADTAGAMGDVDREGRNSSGRSALYNVLKAYSLHDEQVGYCQGMGFPAGLFLMYMTEEEAFWMLHCIARGEKYLLSGMWSPGFPLLFQCFYQFSALLKKYCPKLSAHLLGQEIPIVPELYATHWFMTLFSYNLPFDVVLRIWDILLAEGPKIIFRLAIFFCQQLEPALLREKEFGPILDGLKNLHKHPMMDNPDFIIEGALKLPITRAELSKLANEYQAKKFHQEQAAQMKRQGGIAQHQAGKR